MRGVIDKSLFAAGLVVLVAATAYFNGIDGDFVFDDIPLVSTDEFYSDPGTSTMDCWSRSYWRDGMDIGQYRPVTLFSFLLNVRLAGMSSSWFRFVNLLLHIAVSLLVLKLATRLGLNRETAIFAALLFAAHPLHSEAVIPATGRAELLCAAFILLGLIAYSKIPIFPSRARKFEGDAISFATMKTTALTLTPPLFFILACWSKENGVVLLPLCILYDVCFRRKHDGLTKNIFSTSDNNTGGEPTTTPTGVFHPSESENSKTPFTLVSFLKNYAGFAVALAILAVSRLAATGSVIPKLAGRDIFIDNPICNAPTGVRILTAFHVQGMALLKFVWPATLSHDYSFARITPVSSIFDPLAIFAVFSLLVLPFAIFRFLTGPARPAFLFL
ncbi:MAG: DUF1736 domain-containing protein, partial [Kiritimatiellaeota bacterium]|nr:DUF1736 domain-containing protein [Kiritimatiellota bacterium]